VPLLSFNLFLQQKGKNSQHPHFIPTYWQIFFGIPYFVKKYFSFQNQQHDISRTNPKT